MGSSRDIWKMCLFPGPYWGFSLLGEGAMNIILVAPWHPAGIPEFLP